jgi:hypothetical protein
MTAPPVQPTTAVQQEYAAILGELRALAPRLREAEAHELRVLCNRLHMQVLRDVAALEYSDAALDRALAFYRANRGNAAFTPRSLMDGLLTAARGRDG